MPERGVCCFEHLQGMARAVPKFYLLMIFSFAMYDQQFPFCHKREHGNRLNIFQAGDEIGIFLLLVEDMGSRYPQGYYLQ